MGTDSKNNRISVDQEKGGKEGRRMKHNVRKRMGERERERE